MKLRGLMFSIFSKIVRLLSEKKFGKLPLAYEAFRFLYRYLRPRDVIDLIEVEGEKMYVDRGAIVSKGTSTCASALMRGYEQLVTKLFKQEIKQGMIVVDIGAHIGYFTLLAAKLVGEKGKVFAFEPDPDNYSLLIRNINVNGHDNAIPIQKAVSNKTGQVRLFLDGCSPSCHSLYENHSQRGKFVNVDSITLDEFFEEDSQIDFIKMDIEGAEMAALQGMDNLIKKSGNLKLVTEFNPNFLERAGYSPGEFLGKLTEYGFKLYDINEEKNAVEPCNADLLLKTYTGGKFTNLLGVKE